MKHQLLFLFLILSLATSCQKNYNLEEYPALKLAKETSLYKDDVYWDEIIPNYIEIAKSSNDKAKQYEYLLNALGDDHGGFRSSKNFQFIAYYTGVPKNKGLGRTFNSKFHNAIINNPDARFEHKLIAKNIGYLKVVGIGPQNPMDVDARQIQDAIAQLILSGATRWILDLRYNGGGNMNPMMSGLATLLGEGNAGGSTDKAGNHLTNYEIKDGKFIDTENLVINIDNPVNIPVKDKIAILLSKYTASSGEVVAVAFKGKENVKYFGEKTRGKTTVTGYDFIDDETIMLISKAYYRDRNDNVYTDGVEVDVDYKIPFEEFAGFDDDEIMNASIEWLNH